MYVARIRHVPCVFDRARIIAQSIRARPHITQSIPHFASWATQHPSTSAPVYMGVVRSNAEILPHRQRNILYVQMCTQQPIWLGKQIWFSRVLSLRAPCELCVSVCEWKCKPTYSAALTQPPGVILECAGRSVLIYMWFFASVCRFWVRRNKK